MTPVDQIRRTERLERLRRVTITVLIILAAALFLVWGCARGQGLSQGERSAVLSAQVLQYHAVLVNQQIANTITSMANELQGIVNLIPEDKATVKSITDQWEPLRKTLADAQAKSNKDFQDANAAASKLLDQLRKSHNCPDCVFGRVGDLVRPGSATK